MRRTNVRPKQGAPLTAEPRYFETAADFGSWLEAHGATESELVVGFMKVGSGRPSMTWPEAVDEALCVGWIDGIRRRVDDERYSIRFTPRRATSNWSDVNIARVAVLEAEGRMKPEGLAAFARRTDVRSRSSSYEQEVPPTLDAAGRAHVPALPGGLGVLLGSAAKLSQAHGLVGQQRQAGVHTATTSAQSHRGQRGWSAAVDEDSDRQLASGHSATGLKGSIDEEATIGRLHLDCEMGGLDKVGSDSVRSTARPVRHTAAIAGLRLVSGFVLLLSVLLLSAGTTAYWQAWVYMAVLFVPMTALLIYLVRHDPELLERRVRTSESQPGQRAFVVFASLCYAAAFLLPGIDKRLGWSSVPVAAVFLADALVLLGYALFAAVLRENRYASRVVEVERGQSVITTGPYALVRHPMYLAILIMITFTPVALGSWWGMVAALPLAFVLAARIRSEERLLMRELEGYSAYVRVTRFRLVPWVW